MPSITFKPYARRDGTLMLYINRSNGVSIGLSADRGFSPYGKGVTPGQRNAWDAAARVMAEQSEPYTGDLATHDETGYSAAIELGNGYWLAGTDKAMIGGMSVGSDGAYVIRNGRIAQCGVAYDEADG